MNPSRICLAFVTATFLGGCASQGSLDMVRTDVDAVKTRLFSVEKDLGGIRDESKSGIGAVEKSFKADVAAVRRMSADIQATIDSTKGEMQSLNGRVDDMALAVKKPAEELKRYREDADRRIVALEERVMKLQAALDDLARKSAEIGPLQQQVQQLLQQKKEESATPEALYMKGLETFKAGSTAAARELFSRFLAQHPRHALAANAQFWIGETHYSEKNYEPAILAYQEVIKTYPESDRLPAAMLKQAMAFRAIDDDKSARFVFKKLIETFPQSEEAKKAKDLLK